MSGSRKLSNTSDRWVPRGGRVAALGTFFCVLVAAYPAAVTTAAEWSAEGIASLTGKFDDNIRLRTSNEQAVFGAIFTPQLGVHGRSQLWDLQFKADAAVAQYTEDSNLNSQDPRVRLDASYRTQLGLLKLQSEASRTSTLVTEETDAGRFEASTQRNLFRAVPSWSYNLTPLDTISLGGSWTEAFYESNALSDYRNLGANAGWARQVTPADVLSLTLVADHFVSESAIDLSSNALAAVAGWEHMFSERLETTLAAGPQYFITEVPVLGASGLQTNDKVSLGYRVNAGIEYRLSEQTTLGASFSHQIEPTGSGSPLQRNKFEVNARHRFQPRWSGSARVYFQLDDSPISGTAGSRDRTYVSFEPRLIYRLAENWDLSGSYRFRTQDTDTADRAFSNAVFATVTYRPSRWTFGH